MRVLIADVNSRKNFDIVNIIQNKYKLKVILCASRDFKFQLNVIYLKKIRRLRSDNFENFKNDFEFILKEYVNEDIVYLPVSDQNTRNFIKYTSQYKNKQLYYSLPSLELFDTVNNKSGFISLATKAKVPTPKSLNYKDLGEVKNNKIPIILKPKIGQGSVGIVKIKNGDYSSLDKLNLEDYEIQELINSNHHPYGVFFNCINGKIIDAYVHKRIRTFPRSGGVTVFSKIVKNQELINLAHKYTASIGWNGFGMIEFMHDDVNNIWKCIEFNPRVWGSVLLAPYSGNDIVLNHINNLFKRKLLHTEDINYNAKVSWLFPFEILNLITRNISIKTFIKLFDKNTSLINFTYSNFFRTVFFLIYFTINKKSFIRFFKKLKV
jgi:predicted ATP-grasp superfamily ATP-dependent carboligase